MGQLQRRTPGTVARQSDPSWPTVARTTARLWLDRHYRRRAGRRCLMILISALAAMAVGAGVTLAFTQPDRGTTTVQVSTTSSTAALQLAAAARQRASAWIDREVASNIVVGCDLEMCTELQRSGFPAARLLPLQPSAPDPLGAQLVVATPVIRNQFGTRLASVYAPLVMASFGTGTERVDVRAVAPDGSAAFESTLVSARNARMSAGRQLLGNKHVSASAAARAALLAGQVDPRLLVTLSALAAQLPLRLVIFDDPSPGASPDVPLRGAEIGTAASAGLTAMLTFLTAQRPPYQPAVARIAKSAGGQSVVTVRFDALGLMGLPGP
jgi:hypothetical protein